METQRVTVYLYWHYNRYSKEFEAKLTQYECDDVLIEMREIEFPPLPERKALIPPTILVLRKQQSDLRAKAAEEAAELEQHIGELLALEAPQ